MKNMNSTWTQTATALLLTIQMVLSGCDIAAIESTANDTTKKKAAESVTDATTQTVTYETCSGTVGSGVPAFYSTYFRCVDLSIEGTNVVVKTKNLPPHKSAYYPETSPNWVAFDEMGGTRHKNPNTLSEQDLTIKIPLTPVSKGLTITTALVDGMATTSNDEYHGMPLGMALDGVALFHGVAAPGDDIRQEAQGFDSYEGHPQNTGLYHYHSAAPGPLEVLKSQGLISSTVPGSAEVELYGVMCDGTVVLGCTELDGSDPGATGLDGQNGHLADIKDKAGTLHFTNRYHTHLCKAKYPDTWFTPEIQYYNTCGNDAPQPMH